MEGLLNRGPINGSVWSFKGLKVLCFCLCMYVLSATGSSLQWLVSEIQV